MPTILDTLGIATATISYGKEGSFAGKLATVSVQVTAKAIGIDQLRLTWAATGDMFSSFTDSSTGTSGTPGIIVLPQTGQTGFRHGTTTFKDWYYQAVVTAQLDDGQQMSRTYRFQIPAGVTSLDLDMLDEDGVVTILPAIAPILAQTALGRTAVKTAAYTAGPNQLVPVDATTGPIPVTLPAAPSDTTRVLVKKIDASTNAVTVTAGSGDVFNKTGGITAVPLVLMGQAVTVQYDATTAIWTVLSDDIPLAQLDLRYPTAASVSATYVALRGPWVAGTAFPKNSLVIQGGAVYLAAADVPARATFTVADWQALGGGAAAADLVLTLIGAGVAGLTGTALTQSGAGVASANSTLLTSIGGGVARIAA